MVISSDSLKSQRLKYILSVVTLCATAGSYASVFVVSNTNDSGLGSLRNALVQATSSSGPHTINFNIPGNAPQTIKIMSELPAISQQITLDATTQPGASPIGIELQPAVGSTASKGFYIVAGGNNSVIKGFAINGFSKISQENLNSGIHILGANNITIQGNYIGTDSTGTLSIPNGIGIAIGSSSGHTIGGSSPAERNLISGNSAEGIALNGVSSTAINGNFIGIDISGNFPLANLKGINLYARCTNNTIGTGTGNLIAGNHQEGIVLQTSSSNNTIANNIIGLSANGTTPIPNSFAGINIISSGYNKIINNTVSGNGQGILLQLLGGATLLGNTIGLDANGIKVIPNNFAGINIIRSSEITIGGVNNGERNIISGNGTYNIMLQGCLVTKIVGNLIGTDINCSLPSGSSTRAGIYLTRYSDPSLGITDCSGNTIGSSVANGGNVIGGCVYGILIEQPSTKNTVIGNAIGTDLTATRAVPNQVGILLQTGAYRNYIGSVDTSNTGAANIIAYNTKQGIVVGSSPSDGSTRLNAIAMNKIFGNGSLGIDLGNDNTITPNHDKFTPGPNDYQNYPVLTRVTSTSSSTTITGTLKSPNTMGHDYIIQFFSNDVNRAGITEGKTFLGQARVTTNNSDSAKFSVTLPVTVPANSYISATAIYLNGTNPLEPTSTSEFSPNYAVGYTSAAVNTSAQNTVFTLSDNSKKLEANIGTIDKNTHIKLSKKPSYGSVTLQSNGAFVFKPGKRFKSYDMFECEIHKDKETPRTVTVFIVNPSKVKSKHLAQAYASMHLLKSTLR